MFRLKNNFIYLSFLLIALSACGSGKVLHIDKEFKFADYLPDGSRIVAVKGDTVSLLDPNNLQPLSEFDIDPGYFQFTLSPDGKILLAWDEDIGTTAWFIESKEKLFLGHSLYSPQFSPDGSRIIGAVSGRLLTVISLESFQSPQGNSLELAGVRLVTDSRNPYGVGSIADNRDIFISQLSNLGVSVTEANPRYEVRVRADFSTIETCRYVPESSQFTAATPATVDTIQRVKEGFSVTVIDLESSDNIASQSFMTDDNPTECPETLRGGGGTTQAFVSHTGIDPFPEWISEVMEGKPNLQTQGVLYINSPESSFNSYPNRLVATFSPTGESIAFTTDSKVFVWNIDENQLLLELNHSAFEAVFSPNGQLLISEGTDPNEAIVWDVRTGQELRRLVGFMGWVAEFSPNGRLLLASGIYDNIVQIWDVSNGQEVRRYEFDGASGHYARFAPDGKRVLVYHRNFAELWDTSDLNASN